MANLKWISSVIVSMESSAVVMRKGKARFTEFNTWICSAVIYENILCGDQCWIPRTFHENQDEKENVLCMWTYWCYKIILDQRWFLLGTHTSINPVFIFLFCDSIGRRRTAPSTAITYSSRSLFAVAYASGNSLGIVVIWSNTRSKA